MKKVILMLLSLIVLAIVGGALAFSVKSPVQRFCTNDANSDGTCPAVCPNLRSAQIDLSQEPFVCTTTTSGVATRPCKNSNQQDLACHTTTSLRWDQ